MSDDEYYEEDVYDGLYDILDDAGPTHDLAGDLAEHASHSPVWYDDPAGALELYHSDWDYYSDDYYDDDPILSRGTLDGGPSISDAKSNEGYKRGKKRKLTDASNNTDREQKRLLAETIKGTVWANESSQPSLTFQKGQSEKVALLTNWRDLLQANEHNASLRREDHSPQDEAWANDMSLADMGLIRREQSSRVEQEMADTSFSEEGSQVIPEDDPELGEPNWQAPNDLQSSTETHIDSDGDELESHRKRVKHQQSSSINALSRSNIAADQEPPQVRQLRHANKGTETAEGNSSPAEFEDRRNFDLEQPSRIRGRKRKVSDAVEDQTMEEKVSEQRRSRRMASSKRKAGQQQELEPVQNTTRTTRSRKK